MRKKALITGIYGQDGSFLCEQLLGQKYDVVGVVRKNLSKASLVIKKELDNKGIKPRLLTVDLLEKEQVAALFEQEKPDECYHVAAYHVSSEGRGNGNTISEQELFNNNLLMTANILDGIKRMSPNTKIVTAGSCLMYDDSSTVMQDEDTPFCSHSLYGLAKISENMLVKYYRNLGVFVCNAILYNHESHRRTEDFVTKKIVKNMVDIYKGKITKFSLGNLEAEKDWGYAGDYTVAMQLMLKASTPDDYILATGTTHSIREFVGCCADILNIRDWENKIMIDNNITKRKIKGRLCGNSERAKKVLGWSHKKDFRKLVENMIENQMLLDM